MSQNNDSSKSGEKVVIFKYPDRLKIKLGIRPSRFDDEPGHIDPQAIKEADKLINTLCEECPQVMEGHLQDIIKLWAKMSRMPLSKERDDIAHQIHVLAHEIKDIGAMCGYNLAAYFAESLRDYISQTDLKLEAQRIIIKAHIDALQVVQHQDIKDDDGPQSKELKRIVKLAIEKYS